MLHDSYSGELDRRFNWIIMILSLKFAPFMQEKLKKSITRYVVVQLFCILNILVVPLFLHMLTYSIVI